MSEGRRENTKAGGVYAALATPRRPNSTEADTAALLDYLDAITAAGVNGLVLFGATGEFIHFEIGERTRTAGLAIKRSRVPVLVNVSHSTLAGAIALADDAVGNGASGVLLTPPYFYHYAEAQIFEFYSRFVDALGGSAPIYLYNLAPFLNPISPELARRLLQTGAFAGIKDSSGDWEQFARLVEYRREHDFRLLAGNEHVYLRGRLAGADGIVSGVAAAVPELVVAMDQALVAGNRERAEALDGRMGEFLAHVERFPSTLAIRQAGAVRGWNLRHSAVPLDEDTAADVIRFHGWFREWLPQVLAECGAPAPTRT
jgi:dihydrodipicolinate synthase/N-acetylneuraminate lyase